MTQPTFLIVDDQKSIANLLKQELKARSSLPIKICHTLSEVHSFLESGAPVEVALCDLNLPDAPKGEVLKLLLKEHITTVVFSASFNEKKRNDHIYRKVADFVLKDNPAAINYAVDTMLNLHKNPRRQIWLLSTNQSRFSQRLINMLYLQRYQVTSFEQPSRIRKHLKTQKPDMILLEDSSHIDPNELFNLINDIRQQYNSNQLPMMACEPVEHIELALKMMKYGVNDFFNTSFTPEEFYVRLKQNIELSESYREIEYISRRDSLTNLFNRRHFFERGETLFKQWKTAQKPFFTLMIDIDHFKKVNDTYGHQKGDEVIVYVAQSLQTHFSYNLVARFGGEEFCVFGELNSHDELAGNCEALRQQIETESKASVGLPVTISLGLCTHGNSLEHAIMQADNALYTAKETGRNRLSKCSKTK
ncbi:diguanylate cyclase [Thiomicrorhabdus xiamenensis]|uniref:diguanylate cyclase n=1 Tax=Thiomicrorhabdus xiamenensis TaxID=2739063 RepID=A0A7D4NMW3_9GAMM|nr:diguanylate cyclase [Thiomicrorhabdus xiamenensis]QKI88293.1 diguanylate cyclase [Thiomicrorhabdus xiamenensis]